MFIRQKSITTIITCCVPNPTGNKAAALEKPRKDLLSSSGLVGLEATLKTYREKMIVDLEPISKSINVFKEKLPKTQKIYRLYENSKKQPLYFGM